MSQSSRIGLGAVVGHQLSIGVKGHHSNATAATINENSGTRVGWLLLAVRFRLATHHLRVELHIVGTREHGNAVVPISQIEAIARHNVVGSNHKAETVGAHKVGERRFVVSAGVKVMIRRSESGHIDGGADCAFLFLGASFV